MMRSLRVRSVSKLDKPVFEVMPEDLTDQHSADGTSSTTSFDQFCADILGEGLQLGSPRDAFWDGDESTSVSVDSSPLAWPRTSKDLSRLGKLHCLPRTVNSQDKFGLDDKKEIADDAEASEVDMMKERFSKLLLGEDLSGGGKGVSSALAISNAITNLSASVFGELWRLGPLAHERKVRWRREMGWLLSISDYIVEFVPSSQALPDGSTMEVMVTKPRLDLQINLPALRKLDNMLLEALDTFDHTEFSYAERGSNDKDAGHLHRQDDKWWLPTPRVPAEGLSAKERKHLQHQRESINQILKAALAINAQILSEMEVPQKYWDALPKNGKSSLGEALYRSITSEHFSPDALILSVDPSHERNVLELVNRVEAAIHIWRRKLHSRQQTRDGRGGSKSLTDLEKREMLSEKAESLLLLLKHKFPGLPQTILDINKIEFNKDVGHSILESYSRVLESLAFNILSRIDDVLHVDEVTKCTQHASVLARNRSTNGASSQNLLPQHGNFTHLSPFPSLSKSASTHVVRPASPPHSFQNKSLSEYIGWSNKMPSIEAKLEMEQSGKAPQWARPSKQWSYSGNINVQRSPPSRD